MNSGAHSAPASAPQDEMPLIDLEAQRRRIDAELRAAIDRVLAHGKFILGPEVAELEHRLAEFCGARFAVGCSNGTDALAMVLMALGVGPGDAILVPAFTFAATAEVVCWLGATPVFVDVRDDTFNLDPDQLGPAISLARNAGLTPKGIIPVDLFGQPADYDAIEPICESEGLWLLSDAAQSFGATYRGRRVGTIGVASAVSFFPAKPLGCYGDGGAILLDDPTLTETLRSIRVHGKGHHKYDNVRVGLNARLDTLQAAILLAKLSIFEDEVESRQRVASRYTDRIRPLNGPVIAPTLLPGTTSVWAQYTVRLPQETRGPVAAHLARSGIPTAIYYPVPLDQQPAYRDFPSVAGSGSVAERLSAEVLSLPMHPYLDTGSQDRVVDALGEALRQY